MGKLISLSLAVLLAACSGGSPESSINDDSLLSLSIDFQMRDKYSALVSDSFQPSSADDAAIAISKARQWLGNNYAEFQPTSGNFDPVEETLDCQEGSVLRAQKGFVFAPIYHFVFSDCKINSYTFSGEAEMSQSRFDCSGPSLFFRFQDTTIATQDSIVDITGSLSYVSGSLNCGSGAGGPPGEYKRVALDIQNLKTTSESETTHYNDITTTNNSQAPSLLHSDLRVSVTHTAKVEKNNTLQGVSIRLEEPLLISSSPEVAYTGRLTVVADNNESLSYTFAECSKEFVVIRHIDENDAVTEKIVMWADSENLLNLIRSPSVLFWNGFNSPSFFANDPMPYNSQQDVEGC